MENEDGVLALYELHWFRRFILFPPPPPPLTPPLNDESSGISGDSNPADYLSSESPPTLLLHYHSGSPVDDENDRLTEMRIQNPTLQTIFSGKISSADLDPIKQPAVAVTESIEQRFVRGRDRRRVRRRKKKERSKSLSELEFEELKGFIDLGFTFSDAEASDPWLVSILPGLQRLRATDAVESPAADASPDPEETEVQVARPYLSEAWDAAEEEEEEEETGMVLRNWRIPADGEGVVMKDHLRFWAHAVASAVL